ncbi:oligosaccharide flippase family protein [Nocardioides pelophilus]|uniref:oligosaccharide flippase family protein n=1 Tax=Nocardioides pelophilus TaxID=2172019 RepID=UPI00160033A4|nr:oligosaccharide flippase family protein [Nocardioides pelophilus]
MTTAVEHRDALRRTGSAVLALGASELLGKVATFVLFLLLARLLGVADFGLLSFGLSLGLLLAVLSSLGLDSRVVQLGSAQPELLDRCYGALVAIRVLLSAAVLAVTGAVLFVTMTPTHATVVALLVASCLLDTLCDASRAACGALQRQQVSAVVLVVQRFSVLALAAGALVVTGSAGYAAVGYLVGTGVGVVGMHLAARGAGARPQVRGSRPQVRMVLEAAPVMGLGAVAAMGVFRIDAALLGVLLGTTAVGVYGAGYRVFESILFVSWTLSRAYVPVIAGSPDDVQHIRVWAQRAMVVVCAVYLPYGVVLALRGDDLVGLLFGPAYAHPGVLLGLAAAPLLFGVGHLAASVLLALRPDPVVLVASVVALVVNVVLNLWLIPRWGLTAAAVATTVAFLVQAAILLVALTRITGSIVPVRPLAAVVIASGCAGVVVEVVGSVGPALVGSALTYLAVGVVMTRLIDPGAFAGYRSVLTTRATA